MKYENGQIKIRTIFINDAYRYWVDTLNLFE